MGVGSNHLLWVYLDNDLGCSYFKEGVKEWSLIRSPFPFSFIQLFTKLFLPTFTICRTKLVPKLTEKEIEERRILMRQYQCSKCHKLRFHNGPCEYRHCAFYRTKTTYSGYLNSIFRKMGSMNLQICCLKSLAMNCQDGNYSEEFLITILESICNLESGYGWKQDQNKSMKVLTNYLIHKILLTLVNTSPTLSILINRIEHPNKENFFIDYVLNRKVISPLFLSLMELALEESMYELGYVFF